MRPGRTCAGPCGGFRSAKITWATTSSWKAFFSPSRTAQLEQLKRTVAARNRADFEKFYKETLSGCYACHKASDKPFLRPRVPAGPATPLINFDPRADWPH